MLVIFIATTLLGVAQFGFGWGAGVHPVIGHLAELYFLDATKNAVAGILAGEPKYKGSIGEADNWADQIRFHAHWSSPWHFINAKDDPPNSCSVNINRDCGEEGCVVSAIGNNSQLLRTCIANNDVSEPCSAALKFVVHFFGDGGNLIDVRCKNRRRHFHACWDTDIPELLEDQLGGFDSWPAGLKEKIDSSPGDFLTPPTDWISCVDIDNIENCVFMWAKESNALTCSYVYKNFDPNAGDLCNSDYPQGSFPIIETQVAKAGLRLGVYLNLVVTGQPGWGNGNLNFKVQAS